MNTFTHQATMLLKTQRILVCAALLTFSVGALQARQVSPDSAQAHALVEQSAVDLRGTALTGGASGNTVLEREDSFEALGIRYEMTLRGTQGRAGVAFGVPQSEIVEDATLRLRYSWSPALLPEISHIKVSVNGVVVQTLPVPREQGGQIVQTDIPIDPILITGSNWLDLQLIGHYTRDCEDPDHTSVWANIDRGSTIMLRSRQIEFGNDLAYLPVPFFDQRDTRELTMPFVLPASLDAASLRTAGILSSWLGSLASYRGARFPVSVGQLPARGHAVVIATSDQLPVGLDASQVAAEGPSVSIVANPNDAYGKVLLISGRSAEDLRIAATAVALRTPLRGNAAQIRDFQEGQARKPYDAPNWIASDRRVHLGELVGNVNEMNVVGYNPDVIRVNLQLPPDLFVWKSDGIPLHLRYRYSVPLDYNQSRMNLNINDAFVRTFSLTGVADETSAPRRWFSRLSRSPGEMPVSQDVALPTGAFSARSQLRFHFWFERPVADVCKGTFPEVFGAVDEDSYIDLSNIPHFMAMPNLAAFANAGFPFTRMADLSETALVLPQPMTDVDAGSVLDLLGHVGNATGYPTLRLNVIAASDVEAHADKDLILMGSEQTQPLYRTWAKHLPVGEAGDQRRFSMTDWILRRMPGFLRPNPQRVDLPSVASLSARPAPGSVILMGFESPLRAKRSVVAILAEQPADVERLTEALRNPERVQSIQGSVVVVEPAAVTSMAGNQGYYVGNLPPVMGLRWFFAHSPMLLALVLLGFAIVIALLARVLLRWHSKQRLAQ